MKPASFKSKCWFGLMFGMGITSWGAAARFHRGGTSGAPRSRAGMAAETVWVLISCGVPSASAEEPIQ